MRPIIVGIDPGKNEAEPLSPDFPSGARLAQLADMTVEEFRLKFDRVNLHPVAGHPQSQDWDAARNLFLILRGRRVIALGPRVAYALADGDDYKPYLKWVRRDEYITAAIAHPSGRNRWWNDPENVDAAQAFMSKAALPCIHVEGPDGSGKSTLVKYLSKILKYRVRPTQNPPKSWMECSARIRDRIEPGIVCDRSSGLISELVYGPVLRGGTLLKEELMWDCVRSIIHSVVFVYCRPPLERITPTFRPLEDPTHVEGVVTRQMDLVDRYDVVMAQLSREGARVIRYDWTRQEPMEVAKCVG